MFLRCSRDTVVLIAICTAIVINAVAYGAILPLLPVIGEQVDAGPFELALLYAMYPLALLVSVIPLGMCSDRYGRRPVIVVGTVLLLITAMGFVLSGEYWQFIVFRFIQGLSDSAVWVSALPLSAEIGDKSKLGRRSGWIWTSWGLGLIIGPAIGATGSMLITYGALAFISVFVLAFVIRALRQIPTPRRTSVKILRKFRGLLVNPAVVIACMATMIYGFVFGTLEPILPPFFYGTLTVTFIGIYLAVFNGVFTLTQPVFGRLSDRYGEMRIIYLGILAIIVILPLMVLTTNPVIWFILLVVLGVCDAATATPSLSLLNRGVGDEERGLATSLYNILFSIGALTGPVMIAAIIDGVGYLPAMLTMSIVCFIVLITIMNRYKSIKSRDVKF